MDGQYLDKKQEFWEVIWAFGCKAEKWWVKSVIEDNDTQAEGQNKEVNREREREVRTLDEDHVFSLVFLINNLFLLLTASFMAP